MACSTSLFTASRLKLAGACIGGNSMAVWANLATSCGDQVQALSALSRGNRDRENLRMSRRLVRPLSFLSCRKFVRHGYGQVPQIARLAGCGEGEIIRICRSDPSRGLRRAT